jgi:hypothetical protein
LTGPRVVVLYTRRGCGLCDDAEVELRALSQQLGFSLEVRNIDREAELREHYTDVIPVVFADGREVARAPFVAEELRELLQQHV